MNISQPMHPFNKQKFLQLTLQQQHKWAAQLLRPIVEQGQSLQPYRSLEEWLQLPVVSSDIQALSDRFHLHMRAAYPKRTTYERLNIQVYDHISTEPYLPIDIYLDNLRSCHNVGSILRTTEAFRLGTVHFSEQTPTADHPKVQAVSKGASGHVPTHENSELKNLLQPRIALETASEAIELHEYTFPQSFSLLLGNEEYGLSEAALACADIVITIPLLGSKNSLNVACAFSIVAAQIRQQAQS